jgi:hypothetical protein
MLDAIYTASARANQPAGAFLRDALKPRASKFDRVGSFTRYLTARLPDGKAWVNRHLHRVDELPLRAPVLQPLGYGSRSSCVLLGGSPPRVLKFLRSSLGHDAESLSRMSRLERDYYETLLRWYGDIPRLIPHTTHLVLHAPLRGVPVAAQVQELIFGKYRDLQGHTDAELAERLERHDGLRHSFLRFVAATRRAWDEEGLSVDLAGVNNVVLLETPSGPELRIADLGIWHLAEQSRRRPRVYARGLRVLERLERIAGRVEI